MTSFSTLPNEIFDQIATFAEGGSLKCLRLISKHYAALAKSSLFQRGISIILRDPRGDRPDPISSEFPSYQPTYDLFRKPALPPVDSRRLNVYMTPIHSKLLSKKDMKEVNRGWHLFEHLLRNKQEITFHFLVGERRSNCPTWATQLLEAASNLEVLRIVSETLNPHWIVLLPGCRWSCLHTLALDCCVSIMDFNFNQLLMRHAETLKHLRFAVRTCYKDEKVEYYQTLSQFGKRLRLTTLAMTVIENSAKAPICDHFEHRQGIEQAFPHGRVTATEMLPHSRRYTWERTSDETSDEW